MRNPNAAAWLATRLATCVDVDTACALAHPGTLAFLLDAEAWAAANMPQPEGPIPASAAAARHLTLVVNHNPAPALVAVAA